MWPMTRCTPFVQHKFNNFHKFVNTSLYYIKLFIDTQLFSIRLANFAKQQPRSNFSSLSGLFKIISIVLSWVKVRLLYYINNWVYTTNHKRIAVNYFWFVILSGIVGMVLATLLRLEFAYPGVGIFAGDSLQYLSMVTAHGVIMVFFMIMPLLFGAFANFLLPTQLGVHDVAFPRLNSAAFWFLPGGLLMLCQLVCVDRRYQRMNCFNIREVQAILKRKFFTDLINTHDHHALLDKTTMGVRFKTNNINSINSNIFVFYNYGVEFTSKIRVNNYTSELRINNEGTSSFNVSSIFYLFINFFQSSDFFTFLNSVYVLFFKNLYLTSNFFWGFNSLITNLLTFIFIILNQGIAATTALMSNLYTLLVLPTSYTQNSKNLIYFFQYMPLNTLTTTFEIMVNFVNNNLYFYAQWLHFKIIFNNNISFFALRFSEKTVYSSVDSLLLNVYEFFFLIQYLEIWYNNQSNIFDLAEKFPNAARRYYRFSFYTRNFLIEDFGLATIFYFNALLGIKSTLPIRRTEGQQILFTAPFYSLLNYNSYFTYLYILMYLIITLPITISVVIRNMFDFKAVTLVSNEIYDFFINWFLPLLMNDNLFYWSFRDLILGPNASFLDDLIFAFNGLLFSLSNAYDLFLANASFSNILLTLLTSLHSLVGVLFFHIARSFLILIKTITLLIFSTQTSVVFETIYSLSFLSTKSWFAFNAMPEIQTYASTYFSNSTAYKSNQYANEELTNSSRYSRFSNVIFKYDYKSGDYFPKLYKEIYPYLFTTIGDLTSGLRATCWFNSDKYLETFNITFGNFLNNVSKPSSDNLLHNWSNSRFNNTDGFYNFFYLLSQDSDLINKRWIAANALNQKFYRMFHTSSMQQRIYANWRQLKFTREAWRCKLLAARHQKTLFRRYLHEDGVFWSIERNARDLLPGWAMITPFSSRTRFTAIGKTDIGLLGVLLVLNSSIISAANFLVTYRYLSTLNNRKMRDARAFFTEGIMVASWMMIAANPMLVIGIVMLLSDRHWQTSFFDYSGGGDTVLFQHMFWFFGHPEVYIIIIPTFGFTNTILSFYLKKRVSARASLLYSMYTIAFLGFFVWGHHMYMVGLAHTTRMLFSTLTVMISVPAATKIMHWCVTIVNSSFATELPLLFIITFIFFFITGGISGMCVAHTGMDVLFHDTFYVVGHFHVMLAGCAMFASFGAFYFYFPAVFGVKFSRIYAYLHYAYYLLGQLMTVIPMMWLGYAGMPRRVLDYPASMGGWHSVISAGHMLSVAGLMAFFIMIFDSLRQGRAVTRNTFGISRYNTRLNFYLYEIAHLVYAQQKGWAFFRFNRFTSIKLNNHNYINFEPYETTLMSYTFANK